MVQDLSEQMIDLAISPVDLEQDLQKKEDEFHQEIEGGMQAEISYKSRLFDLPKGVPVDEE